MLGISPWSSLRKFEVSHPKLECGPTTHTLYHHFFKSNYNATQSTVAYRVRYLHKHKWESYYSQLIRTIWRKRKHEKEEESQRLLVDETTPILCSPSKRWRIAGQKRDKIYHSVFRPIHMMCALLLKNDRNWYCWWWGASRHAGRSCDTELCLVDW